MKNSKLIPLVIAFLISACTNKPTQIIVAPEPYVSSKAAFLGLNARLNVTDMRSGSHILQIMRADKAAELFSAQSDLSTIIHQGLESELKKQGLNLSGQANNQIEVFVDNAIISVQQELVKYQANNHITMRVQVTSNEQTLTRTFNSKGSSNGPLQADIAVLERDFNQQLANLLSQIITDKEIQQFIK